jgi:hypothetical protein
MRRRGGCGPDDARSRTQTTLTRLAKLLANLNGELEFVEWLLDELPDYRELLTHRRGSLVASRDAVAATLLQFDPGLAVSAVGSAGAKRSPRAVQRYMAGLRSK